MNRHPEEEDIPQDDDYRESEDDDYNPDGSQASDNDSSGDEEESKLNAQYANIQGTGLIKSRARRSLETHEKPPVTITESSVDVDALWAEMNGDSKSSSGGNSKSQDTNTTTKKDDGESKSSAISSEPEMITITRTFKFAGEVKTETKQVPLLSAEGQDYLKEQKLKEKEEQKRKSSLSLSTRKEPAKRKMSLMEEYQMNKSRKINTLEKSRLDWLGFVDKEGIKEDLTKHNMDGYIDRQQFLSRVDEKRESDIRKQRAKQT